MNTFQRVHSGKVRSELLSRAIFMPPPFGSLELQASSPSPNTPTVHLALARQLRSPKPARLQNRIFRRPPREQRLAKYASRHERDAKHLRSARVPPLAAAKTIRGRNPDACLHLACPRQSSCCSPHHNCPGTAPGGTTNMPTVAQQLLARRPCHGLVTSTRSLIRRLEAKVLTCGKRCSPKVPDRNGASTTSRALSTTTRRSASKRLFGPRAPSSAVANVLPGPGSFLLVRQVELAANASSYQIHGGDRFHTQVWKAELPKRLDSAGVRLYLPAPTASDSLCPRSRSLPADRQKRFPMEYTATTRPTQRTHQPRLLEPCTRTSSTTGSSTPAAATCRPARSQDSTGRIDPSRHPDGLHRAARNRSRIAQVDKENYDHCYVLSNGRRAARVARVEESRPACRWKSIRPARRAALYRAR